MKNNKWNVNRNSINAAPIACNGLTLKMCLNCTLRPLSVDTQIPFLYTFPHQKRVFIKRIFCLRAFLTGGER